MSVASVDGASRTGVTEPPAPPPARRLGIAPLRFACINVALGLLVAIALIPLDISPSNRPAVSVPDALRPWLPDGTVRGGFAALRDNFTDADEWVEGKHRYAETLGILRPSAPLPSAGTEMEAPFIGALGMLAIASEHEVPGPVRIEVQYQGAVTSESLAALPLLLGPFWKYAKLDVRLTTRSIYNWWQPERSEWRSVALGEKDQPVVVEFPKTEHWRGVRLIASWQEGNALENAAHEELPPTILDADIIDTRADWSLPWRSARARPKVRAFPSSGSHPNAAFAEVRGRRRYVGLCAWSPSGRLPLIRGRRSDTQEWVGARAPDLPLYAVMADRYATIQLDVVAQSGDLDDMQIVVVTSDNPPGLPLFVETIGHALASLRSNEVTLDSAAQRRAGLWLRQVLGVEWEQRDVDAVALSDVELAAILTSLH